MPHRLLNMVEPLAQLHARKIAPALEALCAHACTDTALASALVARGVAPGIAQMTVEQWRSLGLLIPADVYAPAHILETTLMGTAGPVAQQVAAADPWLVRSIALSPGYERAMAALPGVAGIPPAFGIAGMAPPYGMAGMAPPFGMAGIMPGFERMMGVTPGYERLMGIAPGVRAMFDPA